MEDIVKKVDDLVDFLVKENLPCFVTVVLENNEQKTTYYSNGFYSYKLKNDFICKHNYLHNGKRNTEKKELAVFSIENEKKVKKEIDKFTLFCSLHYIPCFLTVAKENDKKKTEYITDFILPRLCGKRLTEDKIKDHILISKGFDVKKNHTIKKFSYKNEVIKLGD